MNTCNTHDFSYPFATVEHLTLPPPGVDLNVVFPSGSARHNAKLDKIRRLNELEKAVAALQVEVAQLDDEGYSYDEFLRTCDITHIEFSTCGHHNNLNT